MNYELPKNPRYVIKQANWRATLANQARRIGQYGKDIVMHEGKFNPIQGIPRALRRGYDSTAVRTGGAKRKNMVVDALENMRGGRDVRNVATGQQSGGGVRQFLRDRGFLSVGRKTQGRYNEAQQQQINDFLKQKGVLQESKGGFRVNAKLKEDELRKALNEARQKFTSDANLVTRRNRIGDAAYNILPGEKSILLGFGGLGAGAELAQTHTAQGREKSLAERIGRAGTVGAVETLAAPLGIARRFGALGTAAEIGSTVGAPIGMAVGDQIIGNPAMKKRASAYEDLTPVQKAMIHHRITERGIVTGYKTPKNLKVGLVDGVNPLKLKENYQKHRKNTKLKQEHMAKQMFRKKAGIPSSPRAAIRGALK